MSAVEPAVQEVKVLSEVQVKMLLAWLRSVKTAAPQPLVPAPAGTARGFARRYRSAPHSAAEWMKELREGER